MPRNLQQYREQLYRLRSHPKTEADGEWVDNRDSFFTVYFSAVPFVLVEYLVEQYWRDFPSALFFPMGYLLFWAFYYTYYKPNFLEDHLSSPRKWNLLTIPSVLIGLAIWFVKVTVVELSRLFLLSHLFPKRKERAQSPGFAPHPGFVPGGRAGADNRTGDNSTSGWYRTTGTRPNRSYQSGEVPSSGPSLPPEIREALFVLGLDEKASWREIQKRYHELARLYHPDLNPESTQSGKRFMMYHAAYHRLQQFRAKDFSGRK